jgi:hypothetical protein
MLQVHRHKNFRKLFVGLLIIHLIILLFENTTLEIPIPQFLFRILDWFYQHYPLMTIKMATKD